MFKVWNIDDLRNATIKQTKDARSVITQDLDHRHTVSLTPSQVRYISTKVEKASKIKNIFFILRNSNYIHPLLKQASSVKPFYTMDLETMVHPDGQQVPVFIVKNKIYFIF